MEPMFVKVECQPELDVMNFEAKAHPRVAFYVAIAVEQIQQLHPGV